MVGTTVSPIIMTRISVSVALRLILMSAFAVGSAHVVVQPGAGANFTSTSTTTNASGAYDVKFAAVPGGYEDESSWLLAVNRESRQKSGNPKETLKTQPGRARHTPQHRR